MCINLRYKQADGLLPNPLSLMHFASSVAWLHPVLSLVILNWPIEQTYFVHMARAINTLS
jgi:hypothetical protein